MLQTVAGEFCNNYTEQRQTETETGKEKGMGVTTMWMSVFLVLSVRLSVYPSVCGEEIIAFKWVKFMGMV